MRHVGRKCAGIAIVLAATLPASASVIYQEGFPGSGSSPLNGTTPAGSGAGADGDFGVGNW